MPECIKCGEDTKFDGGLCYSCYKKGGKSKDVKVAEKKVQNNRHLKPKKQIILGFQEL